MFRMYNVKVNISIPFEVQSVEGKSVYEAVENVKAVLLKTLPLVIADNLSQVQERVLLSVVDIKEV